jgi:hypothetical protein
MPEATANTGVKYIGREAWIDRLYGSNLPFEPGQIRVVPELLAFKFLRHVDVFEPAEPPAAKKGKKATEDDTAEILAQAQREQAEKFDEQSRLQDLRDRINSMTKEGVLDFAQVNYRQNLDANLRVETLRLQATALVDQFGAV